MAVSKPASGIATLNRQLAAEGHRVVTKGKRYWQAGEINPATDGIYGQARRRIIARLPTAPMLDEPRRGN